METTDLIMLVGLVLMITALVLMYRCAKGKSSRRKTEELAEALVSVKKDFAYKLQRFDCLLEKIADENENLSLVKNRIVRLQEIAGELEEKRGELEATIATLANIHAELRRSSAALVEKSARLRNGVTVPEQTLREAGQSTDTPEEIKDGPETALENLVAEEIHYLAEPVSCMGITPSVRRQLEARGILHVGDLIPLDKQYLRKIQGIGPATFEKIQAKMNENGVWFGMDVIRTGNHWYRRKQELTTD